MGRCDGHAYFFLKDALDFTLKRVMEETGGKVRLPASNPES
mgnify:CR=1 FL=1